MFSTTVVFVLCSLQIFSSNSSNIFAECFSFKKKKRAQCIMGLACLSFQGFITYNFHCKVTDFEDCFLIYFMHSKPLLDFPGGSDGKDSACNVGDPGLIPGSGRYPGVGNGYPHQYSCLENSMNRGALWAAVHAVTKKWT